MSKGTDPAASSPHGKLEAKGRDAVAANRVGMEQDGFERDENALRAVGRGGGENGSCRWIRQIARQLVALNAECYVDPVA